MFFFHFVSDDQSRSSHLILSRGRGGMVKNSRHFWRSVKNLKFKNHRIFLPFKRFKYLKTVTPTVQNEIIELIIVDRWTNYFQQLIKVCFQSCVTVHNLMDLFCFIYLQVHYNIFWIMILIGFRGLVIDIQKDGQMDGQAEKWIDIGDCRITFVTKKIVHTGN